MKKFLFYFSFILALTLGIRETNAKLFGLEEFYLDNGMRVIVVPNNKAPIIKHMVWYKAGSVDEQYGKGGVAHLLEHLMFRGTKNIKKNDFNIILEKNGAESNAFTSFDMTSYHQMLDISRLELAMFLEADRMQNLEISDEDFALERDIVFQERKQVIENNPASKYSEAVKKTFWGNHAYGKPITGEAEEILNLKKEDIQDFYNKFYAPNNAILVLSGDIDAQTAKKLAQKYYGNLSKKEVGTKADFEKIEDNNNYKLEMALPEINSISLSKYFVAPSVNTNKEDVYNLMVFSKYLGEGDTSKLYKKLVKENKKAMAISSSYNFLARSYSTFNIGAIPENGVSTLELDESIKNAVNEAIDELSLDEVEKVKDKMISGLVYLRDDPEDAAYIVGSMASVGMSADEIENYEANIKRVNYKDVKKAAQKLFKNSRVITGVLKPVGDK